jgi:murein DD-endopeptidase MepM/ murein hydrolase activator NlpD
MLRFLLKQKKQVILSFFIGTVALVLALTFFLGSSRFMPFGYLAEQITTANEQSDYEAEETAIPDPQAANYEIIQASLPPAVQEPLFVEPELVEPEVIEPRFILDPPNARPGEPVTVAFGYNFGALESGSFHAALLNPAGRRLARAAFFSLPQQEDEQQIKAAILAVPTTAAIGDAIIRIESATGVIKELPFTINYRQFGSETIHLDPVNTELRTAYNPQRTAESEHLWRVISRTGTEIYSTGPFVPPVTSTRRTSLFGFRRVFEYSSGTSDTSIHAGVDYGVPTGTEVMACARGRVVLARPRILTGNSVILEHLPGVYSLYYHLDTIAVSEGVIVEEGEFLGYSGATGLATGPHLHWEIRVSGENADPDAFLPRPVLDINQILSKMRE